MPSDATPSSAPPAGVPLVGSPAVRVVEVTGADRLGYLDAVLSQRLRDAEPGTVTSALELDAHGSPTAVLDVVVRDAALWLLVPEAVADDLVPRLAGRTFLSDARFAERDDLDVVRVVAPLPAPGDRRVEDRAAVAALLDGTVPSSGEPPVAVEVPVSGWHVVVPRVGTDDLVATLVAAGAVQVDGVGLEAAEVVHGVPRAGVEVAAGVLPEELGLLPTHVHLDKGCYPGQEAVARMWMLGRPRRRLARVRTVGEVGAGWEAGQGRDRTRVTRVAPGGAGLALVPATTGPGVRFEAADGSAVEVLDLVGADRPQPGHDPAVPRRRDRRDAAAG